MLKMTLRENATGPVIDTSAGTLKEQGYRPAWDGANLLLTRVPEVGHDSDPRSTQASRTLPGSRPPTVGVFIGTRSAKAASTSDIASGLHAGDSVPAPHLPGIEGLSDRSTLPMRDLSTLVGRRTPERILINFDSRVEQPRSPGFLEFKAQLNTNWQELRPWTPDIPSAPTLAGFSLPPNFTKRVARPLSDMLDLAAIAAANPSSAHQSLLEAERVQTELLKRMQSGRDSDSIRRGLTYGGRLEMLQQVFEMGPTVVDTLGLCHQALGVAGFHSDQLQFDCVRTRVLDRSVSATSELGEIPDLFDTVVGVFGMGLDYSRRLREARVRDDDDMRAWATATGDFVAHRGLSVGLAALSGYLCVIPAVGPMLGALVALFSGALASKLLAPLPG